MEEESGGAVGDVREKDKESNLRIKVHVGVANRRVMNYPEGPIIEKGSLYILLSVHVSAMISMNQIITTGTKYASCTNKYQKREKKETWDDRYQTAIVPIQISLFSSSFQHHHLSSLLRLPANTPYIYIYMCAFIC
jgi:hypothetical protein